MTVRSSLLTFSALLFCISAPCLAAPKLDPQTCQAIMAHKPDASITYQEGVDVNGEAVVRADIQTYQTLASEIKIPLTINLLKALNVDPDSPALKNFSDLNFKYGYLVIKGNKAHLNETPMTKGQLVSLSSLCQEAEK